MNKPGAAIVLILMMAIGGFAATAFTKTDTPTPVTTFEAAIESGDGVRIRNIPLDKQP